MSNYQPHLGVKFDNKFISILKKIGWIVIMSIAALGGIGWCIMAAVGGAIIGQHLGY